MRLHRRHLAVASMANRGTAVNIPKIARNPRQSCGDTFLRLVWVMPATLGDQFKPLIKSKNWLSSPKRGNDLPRPATVDDALP
jgi:hypothetical protein